MPTDFSGILGLAPAGATALVVPETGRAISYGSLRESVDAVADALRSLGIRRGDRVATCFANGPAGVVTFLAGAIAGTACPLNPGYREEEVRFYLEDTGAKILLCPPSGADEARKAAQGTVPVHTVDMDDAGRVRIEGITRGRPGDVEAIRPDDIALVLHTSGGTGRPKRVPLRHRHLATSARNIAGTYSLSGDDVALLLMPLFHVHGLVASTLSTFFSGGAVVTPAKFNPLSFWRMARETRATWFSAVPTIHQLLLSRGERAHHDSSLRFVRSCSASLNPETLHKLEAAFSLPVIEAYGMTEAAHQMCSNPLPPGPRKVGTVGPGRGVRVSIMDGEGRHLGMGERGEVVIQGESVVSEYENNPEANKACFVDGWFRTGDQGFLDEDHYLTLTGRIKELINRAGEKIAPREIDEVLLRHPSVAEAVAFGMPHPVWGEEVVAAVVLKEETSEAALVDYCKGHLADFKCPKKVYFVTEIPRTATGKIQRGNLASAFREGSR